jgi:hypothetical protein
MSTKPLFLGLDLSTQQLKAVLLSQDSTIVHETFVHFDRDLPHHGTVNGAIRGPGSGEVTSPVGMWVEAIDLLFQRLKADQVDFGAISAISGAAQVIVCLRSSQLLVSAAYYSNMARCTGQTKLLPAYPSWILTNRWPVSFFQLPFPCLKPPFGKTLRPLRIVNDWRKFLVALKLLQTVLVVVPMNDLRVIKLPE